MINALDSPIEALALNHLSFDIFTAVNNIWTWVAVVTGTVSFLLTLRKPAISITGAVLPDPEVQTLDPSPAPPAMLAISPAPSVRAVEVATDLATKEKFMVYYEDDVVEVGEECDADVVNKTQVYARKYLANMNSAGCWSRLNELSSSTVKSGWLVYPHRGCELDGMMRMRILTGDEMGWYRYQDLTMLDGNVVRLWDN